MIHPLMKKRNAVVRNVVVKNALVVNVHVRKKITIRKKLPITNL